MATLTLANMEAAQALASKLIAVNTAIKVLAGNPKLAIASLNFASLPAIPSELVTADVFNAALMLVLNAEQAALVAALQALGAPVS